MIKILFEGMEPPVDAVAEFGVTTEAGNECLSNENSPAAGYFGYPRADGRP
jgi:hypothetical protein